jgi:hypothetical protein
VWENIERGDFLMSVTTQLVGGLGNQLFQYAAGRSLSLKLGQPLHLDIAPFKKYKLHHYALNHFNISAKTTHVNKLKMYLPKLFNLVYFKEKTFEYQPEIKNLSSKKDIYLEGYGQTNQSKAQRRRTLRVHHRHRYLIRLGSTRINFTHGTPAWST